MAILKFKGSDDFFKFLPKNIRGTHTFQELSRLRDPIRDNLPRKTISLTRKCNWFDLECVNGRREVQLTHKEATRTGDWSNYRTERRRYKTLLKKKRNAELEQLEERLRQVRDINDAWKFINRA